MMMSPLQLLSLLATVAAVAPAATLAAPVADTAADAAEPCGAPRPGQVCVSAGPVCGSGAGAWFPSTAAPAIEIPAPRFTFSNGDVSLSSSGVKLTLPLLPQGSPLLPSGAQLTYKTLSADLKVGSYISESFGQAFGLLSVKDLTATGSGSTSSSESGSVISFDLKDVPFPTAASDSATVSFYDNILTQYVLFPQPVQRDILGHATITAVVSDGGSETAVCLESVPIFTSFNVTGMSGFKGASIDSAPVIQGASSSGLDFAFDLSIPNPSAITLDLNADVVLTAEHFATKVVTVTLPNFSIRPGPNKYRAAFRLHPDPAWQQAVDEGRAVLQNTFGGSLGSDGGSGLTLRLGSAPAVPHLDFALSNLFLPTTLPPAADKLSFAGARVYLSSLAEGDDPTGLPFLTLAATARLRNPYAAPITVAGVNATLRFQGTTCLTVGATFADLRLPPSADAPASPAFQVVLPNSVDGPAACTTDLLNALLTSETLPLDVVADLAVSVDGVDGAPIVVRVAQDGVAVAVDYENLPPAAA
ncbi:hypothetical protein DFJ73DRAFT_760881 [Zopfochytrium polystomum]|nr:hypothetical protein DFJ73DRAFT_760881 [Zopfochytrium polystomum]